MAAPVNKQPIFTATPITVCIGADLTRNPGSTYLSNDVTVVYIDGSTNGTMINKVTVNANATLEAGENTVSSKRIDFYISTDDDSSIYTLYSSKYITGLATITAASTVPSVVFEFPTGLVLSPGKRLALSATENSATSGYNGDLVSIIVEGGTYDQPA